MKLIDDGELTPEIDRDGIKRVETQKLDKIKVSFA